MKQEQTYPQFSQNETIIINIYQDTQRLMDKVNNFVSWDMQASYYIKVTGIFFCVLKDLTNR